MSNQVQTKVDAAANYMTEKFLESIEIYRKKNTDYGDSFGKSIKEFGNIAALIRIGDKYNRLKALTKNGYQEVLDELIIDTLVDLANYSMMFAYELKRLEEIKAAID